MELQELPEQQQILHCKTCKFQAAVRSSTADTEDENALVVDGVVEKYARYAVEQMEDVAAVKEVEL